MIIREMDVDKGHGLTYFAWWGFSINEGMFPNIHINWRNRFFYCAFRFRGRVYRWSL